MNFRYAIVSAMVLIASACASIHIPNVVSTIQESRGAVARVIYLGGSCSAFHIGAGKFITAAHCFEDDLEKPVRGILLIGDNGEEYYPEIIKISLDKDLALLFVSDFTGGSLNLWDKSWDGELPLGAEILTLGYPEYYDFDFQFEHGYIKDQASLDGTEMVVSASVSYSGESGGPVISLSNGKVIGMVDAGVEKIQWHERPGIHMHVSLSFFVSANEIHKFLE